MKIIERLPADSDSRRCLGHQQSRRCLAVGWCARRNFFTASHRSEHDGKTIFAVEAAVSAGRYHSLIVEARSLPKALETSGDHIRRRIMGLRHRQMKVKACSFISNRS